MAERITQRSGRFPESWRRVGTFLKPRNRGQPRGERACSYNESWRYTLPPRRQGALNRDAQRCKAVERNPCCVYIYVYIYTRCWLPVRGPNTIPKNPVVEDAAIFGRDCFLTCPLKTHSSLWGNGGEGEWGGFAFRGDTISEKNCSNALFCLK